MDILYIPAAIALIALAYSLFIYRAAVKAGKGMGARVGFIAMGAPKFWHYMPPADDSRLYEIAAGLNTPYGKGAPRKFRYVRGVRDAYIEVRKMGIEVEQEELRRNPRMSFYEDGSYPNSVGVYWEMTPVEEKDENTA